MRNIIIILIWASVSVAAVEPGVLPGTVVRPGFNSLSVPYFSSVSDTTVQALWRRFACSYAAYNPLSPSTAIIIAPRIGSTVTRSISDGNIESAARNFISSAGLVSSNCSLDLISKKLAMGRVWFINFRKSLNGVPVEDDGLNLAVTPNGHVSVLWGALDTPTMADMNFALSVETASDIARRGLEGAIVKSEYLGQSILPLYFGNRIEYHPIHKYMIITNDPYAEWLVFVDAQNGQILQRADQVCYEQISGTVSGQVQPLYPFDLWEYQNFSDISLDFSPGGAVATDSAGHYIFETPGSGPVDIQSSLRGPYLVVMNDAGPEAHITESIVPPANYNVTWDYSNSLPQERDAWRSGVFAHNWIVRLDTGLQVINFPMVCHVNVDIDCNAFWSRWYQSINFSAEGDLCFSTAQLADIVYHEYGHGITDLQTRPLTPNGGMSEGFSDYQACTITNQPHVGVGLYFNQPDGFLRDLDNNMRYPDNWIDDPHNDGQIISGALWHARQALSPYPMGYADSLWHFARYACAQDFEPYFWAYVALDDSDSNLANGTPHAWSIFNAFGDRHGIGPGTQVTITANTILDSEDTTCAFPVSATISSVFSLRPDSVILFYDNGEGLIGIQMSRDSVFWSAQIPPQPNNTLVSYYVSCVDSAGFRGTYPAAGNRLSFFVGPDRIPPTMTLVRAPSNTVDLNGPYGPFVISAYDINGLNPNSLRFHYCVNSESERLAYLTTGVNPDEYIFSSLDLYRHLFTGDTIFYYFTSRDLARTPNNARLPSNGSYFLAMTTSEMIDDFETAGLDRWSVSEGWVLSDDGYNSQHALWFGSPNYPNNANSAIAMNYDVDLSSYSHGSVTFYHKNRIASGDTCFVEASNDGGASWLRVGEIADTMLFYSPMACDISRIIHPDFNHYRIRFRFVSDEAFPALGVMIDNINWLVEPALDGVAEPAPILREIGLAQNYPNPFNPQTRIDFVLPFASNVRLEIFNLLGQRITTLADDRYEPGNYNIIWNGKDEAGRDVASGLYFYRLTTDTAVRQQKMTLLR